jgi:hypothetical protein
MRSLFDYSRDWDFLARISVEFGLLRSTFKIESESPQIGTLRDVFVKIVENPDLRRKFPNLLQLYVFLTTDEALKNCLSQLWKKQIPVEARKGLRIQDVLPLVFERIYFSVCRNSGTWIQTQRPDDSHWARFWNDQNLVGELRRAMNGFSMPFATGFGGRDDTRANPEMSSQNFLGRGSRRPEQVAAILEEYCIGFDQREAACFREWYWKRDDEDDDWDKQHATRHFLRSADPERELDKLLLRALANRKRAIRNGASGTR